MPHAEELDGALLGTLCSEPGPWRVEELRREHDDGIHVDDALTRLLGRGLVQRMKGGFIVTTAAGRYAHSVSEKRP